MNTPASRRSASAFRQSFNARVRQVAHTTGRPVAQIHREFYLLRFLGRVFEDPDSPWVLKGGSGLLVRISDGAARHSRDADLLRLAIDTDRAVTELRGLCERTSDLDPFTFEVKHGKNGHRGPSNTQLITTVYYGAAKVHDFPVDLSIRPLLASTTDRVVPTTLLDIDGVAALPPFRCLSLADQVADKVAAMYELHGAAGTPSTRWHDLVDLVLILERFPLDAATTLRALRIQEQRRDHLALPTDIRSPGPQWESGYPREAATSSLPPRLHHLGAALTLLGRCVNPLLDGTRTTGTWNPTTSAWHPGVPSDIGA